MCLRIGEIYFKELAHVIVEVWWVQNVIGEVDRLGTQEVVAV